MEATRRLIAGTVKSVIYVTTEGATACVDKKTLAPQVSAFGQVSKWRRPRNDVEVAPVEAVGLPDEK